METFQERKMHTSGDEDIVTGRVANELLPPRVAAAFFRVDDENKDDLKYLDLQRLGYLLDTASSVRTFPKTVLTHIEGGTDARVRIVPYLTFFEKKRSDTTTYMAPMN